MENEIMSFKESELLNQVKKSVVNFSRSIKSSGKITVNIWVSDKTINYAEVIKETDIIKIY